jgi:hypothetical protein
MNMAISSIGIWGLTGITQANQTASRTELAQKLLKDMDTDQSGTVSKNEFVAFGEKMKAQRSAPQGTNEPTPPSSNQLFASADKNGDQSLSVDELSAMMAQAETQSRASGGRREVDRVAQSSRSKIHQRWHPRDLGLSDLTVRIGKLSTYLIQSSKMLLTG